MLQFYTFSKTIKNEKKDKLLDDLYNLTKELEKDYPTHYNWFHNKFCKELNGNVREIIFCLNDNIPVGVAFLKKTIEEQKICTIYVKKEYRNIGIGTQLLLKSFEFLNTCKPLISMPEYKVNDFLNIISNYKWKKTQIIESCYSNNKEIVFNGFLK